MAFLVRMPALTEMMVEGTILEWHVREGEAVTVGQTLFNIETEKANFEIPAADPGIVLKILAPQGETVSVGATVAVIGESGERWDGPSTSALVPDAGATPTPARPAGPEGKQLVSPVARRMARDQGIDLSGITGTGPNKMVTKEDIELYLSTLAGAAPQAPAPAGPTTLSRYGLEESVPFAGRRKAIAERMALSRRTAADVTTVMEVDCQALERLRDGRASYSYTTFLLAAVARALPQFPYLNATLEGEQIILKKYYNICVAVDTEDGLTTPVIHSADRLSLGALQEKMRQLADRARARSLGTSDLDGGTFTITNAGVFGSLFSTPIINYPQCAILGMGKVVRTPVAVGEQIVIHPLMLLFLTYDHRIVDGGQAVRFLQTVKELLEGPRALLDLKDPKNDDASSQGA